MDGGGVLTHNLLRRLKIGPKFLVAKNSSEVWPQRLFFIFSTGSLAFKIDKHNFNTSESLQNDEFISKIYNHETKNFFRCFYEKNG